MSDESSISLEETNKIRIQLGLKPIPLPNNSSPVPPQDKVSKQEASLSIDETNKLRLSLGLKPIIVETTVESQIQTTEDYQRQSQSKEKNDKVKENVENLKQRAIRRKKASIIKTLAEEEEEEEGNTDDWLSKIKKPNEEQSEKQKPIRKGKLNSSKPTTNGLKVGHNLADFDSLEGNVILTLKDRSVLDDQEDEEMMDELESNELLKKKKLEKELAEKNRTGKYDAAGNEKNLIDRYNEELGLNKDDHFVLSGSALNVKSGSKNVDIKQDKKPESFKKIKFDLELDEEDEVGERSDYAKAKPIKMKKLKKKSSSLKRQRHEDSVDQDVEMQNVELINEDLDIQDDLELQSALLLKRISNLKKRKKLTPEELAKEIKENEEHEMDVDKDNSSGFVIDENVEFLSSIKNVDEDLLKNQKNDQIITNGNTDLTAVDKYNSINDVQVTDQVKDNPEEPNQVNFTGGLASTLSFLKSKNVVQTKSVSEINKQRDFLNVKKAADLDRLKHEISKRIHKESLEQDSSLNKLTSKERELFIEKELETFKQLQNTDDVNDKLQNYKPEINLKYIDELGREMSTKEAYKHLSHQFHGKAPNKSKIEKKLKKVQQNRDYLKNEKLLG